MNNLIGSIVITSMMALPLTAHAQEDAGADDDAGFADAGDASIDAAPPDYARPDYSPLKDEGGVGWACAVSAPGTLQSSWLGSATWASLMLSIAALRRGRSKRRADSAAAGA